MFFSIVTVTYNAEKDIKKTLESISDQTFTDFELLVIDGESTDKTIEIVDNFKGKIPNMVISSAPDEGIYDAMNKGVLKSKGEYIYFLNSGDCFVNKHVLETVHNFIDNENNKNGNIYHGQIIRNGKICNYPEKFCLWKWLYLERASFSHQAIFSPRQALLEYPFILDFKVCADRDWLIHCMLNGYAYKYMDGVVIANYADGGVSAGYISQAKDSIEISRKYGGRKAKYFVHFKRKIGELLGHER